ncbi:MAG: DNA-binding NarL/FixJ family response regulator [Oceanospirillaceae bacterium]|jgi:DNA-binding NarL/FixJ family response regulator
MQEHTLFLVMKLAIQTRAFADFLNLRFDCKTFFLSNEEELENLSDAPNPLLLVDVAYLPDIDQPVWTEQFDNHIHKIYSVLLNTSENLNKRDLLDWPNCCGIFPSSCELNLFEQGLRKIFAGEYWLPRTMMTELLQYYRKDEIHTEQSNVSLTRRECDVLRLLTICNTNTDIANALFVSEHTVKSHLYKVFKKTDVKNRVQAAKWAEDNLPSIKNSN